jgi:hypothetical protein
MINRLTGPCWVGLAQKHKKEDVETLRTPVLTHYL